MKMLIRVDKEGFQERNELKLMASSHPRTRVIKQAYDRARGSLNICDSSPVIRPPKKKMYH